MKRYNHSTIGVILSGIALGVVWAAFLEFNYWMGIYPHHGWESIGTWFVFAGGLSLGIMARLFTSENPYRAHEVVAVLAWIAFGAVYAPVTLGVTFNSVVAGIATGFYAGITFVIAMWILLWVDKHLGRYFDQFGRST